MVFPFDGWQLGLGRGKDPETTLNAQNITNKTLINLKSKSRGQVSPPPPHKQLIPLWMHKLQSLTTVV